MKMPQIEWTNRPLFKKTPLLLVIAVVFFVGLNVYMRLKIENKTQELKQIQVAAAKPARKIPKEFTIKRTLGEKQCPYQKAGNPNAPLTFKLFESETCPYCIAQNKVMDELLPEYGDLFYAEWYEVIDCPKEAKAYTISGVPTFVFTAQGIEKSPSYGFLDKGQLIDYICRVSGECYVPKPD